MFFNYLTNKLKDMETIRNFFRLIKSYIRLENTSKRIIHQVIIVIILFIVAGCSYYKLSTTKYNQENLATKIEAYEAHKKLIVLNSGSQMRVLSSISIDNDKNELKANTSELTGNHSYMELARLKKVNKKKYDTGKPFHTVHIYTSKIINFENSNLLTLPLNDIDSIGVYDHAVGKEIAMFGLGTVGALAVVTAIIALTKSSCPFVYSNDGEAYIFEGELYPGAIKSKLERDDFLLLKKLKSKDGKYSIQVSNELKEKQYTNLVQLIEVKHNKGYGVLIDNKGIFHTISKLEAPKIGATKDATVNSILFKDNIPYMFNNMESDENGLNHLILDFDKPKEVSYGKLVLTAKNSYWLDFMYGKFNEKFGTYFDEFQRKQESVSAKKSNQWMLDQGIPLGVYVKTLDGWKLVEYVNVVGPLSNRDIVIPINFDTVNSNTIQIKLECGFMFWEIDYAAMDFSENNSIEVTYLSPSKAFDEQGRDLKLQLTATDNLYLEQPTIGNVATIEFEATDFTNADMKKTLFLKNRGYYTYIRNYSGEPNFAELKLFREKGAFTKYSKKEYFQFISNPHMLDLIVEK